MKPRMSEGGWKKRENSMLYDATLGAFRAALEASDPKGLVRKSLVLRGDNLLVGGTSLRLPAFKRIFVIGGGKASGAMAFEVERILGRRITKGLVNVVPGFGEGSALVGFNPASHPIPDRRGAEGVEQMLKLADTPKVDDLFLCVISGGGSAMMPSPAKGLGLEDKQRTTELLLASGATIDEVNAVRKHLSAIKGGRLAQRLYPATVLSLILSDVVGDRVDTIASGPTAPDPTTFREARQVLETYKLWEEAPASVRRTIQAGERGDAEETPKPDSKWFNGVHNVVIGGNSEARKASSDYLRKVGYRVVEVMDPLTGEAGEAAFGFSRLLSDADPGAGAKKPLALVCGGETTVAVKGSGKGGRNQEFVLSAAMSLAGSTRRFVAAFATDGIDGPTGAAGAVADETTVQRAKEAGLDPGRLLRDNDSGSLFSRLGDLIITGPTGTNVNDVFVGLVPIGRMKRVKRSISLIPRLKTH